MIDSFNEEAEVALLISHFSSLTLIVTLSVLLTTSTLIDASTLVQVFSRRTGGKGHSIIPPTTSSVVKSE